MNKSDIAWRGFVCYDDTIIAWPMILADHRQFHTAFGTDDSDFSARWRQWTPGGRPDIDATDAMVDARELIEAWLAS